MKKLILLIAGLMFSTSSYANNYKDISKTSEVLFGSDMTLIYTTLGESWNTSRQLTVKELTLDAAIEAAEPRAAILGFDKANSIQVSCQKRGITKYKSKEYRCLKGDEKGGWTEGVGVWVSGAGNPTFGSNVGYVDINLNFYCLCTNENTASLPIETAEQSETEDTPYDLWYDKIPGFTYKHDVGQGEPIKSE